MQEIKLFEHTFRVDLKTQERYTKKDKDMTN